MKRFGFVLIFSTVKMMTSHVLRTLITKHAQNNPRTKSTRTVPALHVVVDVAKLVHIRRLPRFTAPRVRDLERLLATYSRRSVTASTTTPVLPDVGARFLLRCTQVAIVIVTVSAMPCHVELSCFASADTFLPRTAMGVFC